MMKKRRYLPIAAIAAVALVAAACSSNDDEDAMEMETGGGTPEVVEPAGPSVADLLLAAHNARTAADTASEAAAQAVKDADKYSVMYSTAAVHGDSMTAAANAQKVLDAKAAADAAVTAAETAKTTAETAKTDAGDIPADDPIGIGGHLTMPPLPHHRAYGSVPRRFDRIRPQQGCRVWGGRASRNGGCVGPAGPPHVRPCASTPSASQRRWRLGPLRVPGGGAP